jgi:cytochrome c-type biogenesis protein
LSGTTLSEVQNSNNKINIATTISTNEAQSLSSTVRKSTKLSIFLNTVYFVLGFSLIFAVLGVILNSVLVTVGTGF